MPLYLRDAFVIERDGVLVHVPWLVVLQHDCGSCLCDRRDPLLHCREAMADDMRQAEAFAYFEVPA
jgi:hypothetical protein